MQTLSRHRNPSLNMVRSTNLVANVCLFPIIRADKIPKLAGSRRKCLKMLLRACVPILGNPQNEETLSYGENVSGIPGWDRLLLDRGTRIRCAVRRRKELIAGDSYSTAAGTASIRVGRVPTKNL